MIDTRLNKGQRILPLILKEERAALMFKTVKKYLLIILGSLAVALGVIGIFLPVLPTTPFFLVSFFCYLRSSKRLYQWLIRHKIFGAYLYNYMTYRAVLKSTKICAMIFLWASLTVSILLVNYWYVQALLLLVGIGVSIHLMTLKTMEKSDFTLQAHKPESREI